MKSVHGLFSGSYRLRGDIKRRHDYRKSISTNDSHVVLKAHIKEVKRNIVIIEARLYNKDEELCTEALCTYFTFPKEKAREEMHFLSCEVEDEEILPLI